MEVHSVGLASDLELLAMRGQVLDRGDYLVAITPDDPGYRHGNLLVLRAPPARGELASWMQRFADEIGHLPGIEHVTLRWDGVTGDAGCEDELRAAGFEIDRDQVMTATEVTGRRVASAGELRPLTPDEVLSTFALDLDIVERHDEAYRRFLSRRTRWKSELVARGLARFWGAFDGDRLVASLGLVTQGTRGRYQDVQTARTHRRRGLASALLAAAARESTCESFVIVAVPESDAVRIYERAGFRALERTASAVRRPPDTT